MLAGSFSMVEMVGRASEALAGVDEPDGGTDMVGGLGKELGVIAADRDMNGVGGVDAVVLAGWAGPIT